MHEIKESKQINTRNYVKNALIALLVIWNMGMAFILLTDSLKILEPIMTSEMKNDLSEMSIIDETMPLCSEEKESCTENGTLITKIDDGVTYFSTDGGENWSIKGPEGVQVDNNDNQVNVWFE